MFLLLISISPSIHSIDIHHYHIQLDVSDTSTLINGFCTIHFHPDTENEKIFELLLNESLNIDSIKLNRELTNYLRHGDTLRFYNLETNNNNTLTVYYHGNGKGDDRNGINSAYIERWDQNITWTLSEPFYSKDWLPSNQILTDKIDSVKFILITQSNLKAVSNGLLTKTESLPNNKVSYTWTTKYPLAYYLISFAVSDYLEYTSEKAINGKNLLFSNYIYNSKEYFRSVQKDIDSTWLLIELYSTLFGTYPFINEKYGHAQAPIGGGMEHQTLTTISNFNFELVAHELAHQWWGNLVTCDDWSNIWINESFATYSEYLAYEFLGMKEQADDWLAKTKLNVCSYNDGSVFVWDSLDFKKRIFNQRLSYNKGAMVIHMLRHKIDNDEVFFDILKLFLEKYAFNNAGTIEFIECAETISGLQLDSFFDDWIYGDGYPEIAIKWKQNADEAIIETIMDRDYELNQDFTFLFFRQKSAESQLLLDQYVNYDTFQFSDVIRQVRITNSSNNLLMVKSIEHDQTNKVYPDLNVVYNAKQQQIEFFKSIEKPLTFSLINLEGKVLHAQELTEPYFEWDVSDRSKGYYFVRFTNRQKEVYTIKVLIY